MLHISGGSLSKLKLLIKTRASFNFSVYLLVGFVTALLIGQSVSGALAKPTPNLDKFDPDIHPPIDVIHNPPVIAGFDETIELEFGFSCGYSVEVGTCCLPEATLFVAYGENEKFTAIPLTKGDKNASGLLAASVPVSRDGEPLGYYLQVHDPEVNIDVRFPVEGAIYVFVTSNFIPVDLPAQKVEEPDGVVLALPWGKGSQEVGIRSLEGYPEKLGPNAMDVAEDGKIALLDQVNDRVLIYDPGDDSIKSLPIPFSFKTRGDVQFDQDGGIVVFDRSGEPVGPSNIPVPQLYQLSSDGSVRTATPVFAKIPSRLTKDLTIVDLKDSKSVAPLSPSGAANSREEQRQKQDQELLAKYMTETVYDVRFADTRKGIAFEVHSASPLGAISLFERTPNGYVAVFEADQFRGVWFDSSGNVVQDITLPNEQYTEINPYGRVTNDQDGSIFVLDSTEGGIEVRFVKAP